MMVATARQANCLSFLIAYSARHGVMPSYREIGDGIGLASISGVSRILTGLEERRVIRRLRHRRRAIEIIDNSACPHCGRCRG